MQKEGFEFKETDCTFVSTHEGEGVGRMGEKIEASNMKGILKTSRYGGPCPPQMCGIVTPTSAASPPYPLPTADATL